MIWLAGKVWSVLRRIVMRSWMFLPGIVASARIAQADVELFAHAEVLFAARPRRHLADGWLTLTCPKDKVPGLADWLLMQGAAEVTVAQLDYVFAEKNKLYEKLVARLP